MRPISVTLNGRDVTLYEFFGVPGNAGREELKTAYRKLCVKYHPDKNPENKAQAEQNFKVVQHVWSVLGDPVRRSEYDVALARYQQPAPASVYSGFMGSDSATAGTTNPFSGVRVYWTYQP